MNATVGYPGPRGSNTHAAASVLAPEATPVDLPSFSAVVRAASSAEVGVGVLPIESSLIGPIAETHDLLYGSGLSIVREATLAITHCLVGLPGSSLDRARVIRSHPAALDQCRDLLAARHVQQIPAATTADAAREVQEEGDPAQLAIASPEAAEHYGLEVIAHDVGDKPGAFTRFVALAPYTQIDGGEGWRTALSFVTDHQPGALYRALGALARGGVNLVQLVSRPLPNSPWRYRFDVVLDGHVFDPTVRPALAELRSLTREVRLFGSYQAERLQ
ncbi:MAG TPA: prephenate dehydratase domain-containing protein [Gaiellaceae bacterium]|jgi:prephenate dehydratase|nr:prephenate dehydratase domain-containing protein [Gaiellaceae bacterium]